MRSAILTLGLALLAADTGFATAQNTALRQFTIAIEGAVGSRFDGTCLVETGSGPSEVPLAGAPPYLATIEGVSLVCRLDSEGEISVEVEDGRGGRARSTSSGGTFSFAMG